ncbi:MAG: integrase arm-type DNA-binding domain-containing protein [Sphingobium sp.]|nr:integrase arm-type DNA-binding domain-containing protein [Sphingobium sp.]
MLNNAAVRTARPKGRAYKLFDERGLHLFVAPTGLMAWRLKYRVGGREQLLSIGHYPDLQLQEARNAADRARDLIRAGMDPRAASSAAKVQSFETVARIWHEERRAGWSARHAADVIASLERDIFPAIGALPIGAIDVPGVRAVLREIESRGAGETARRICQRLSGIFAYAITEGLAEQDPAAIVARVLKTPRLKRQHPAIVDIDALRQLLADVEQLGAPAHLKLASRFLALTAVRMGALIGMRWGEVRLNGMEDATWTIPAARMKLALAKKGEERFDHVVPLTRAALDVLRAVEPAGGCHVDALVFPGLEPDDIAALYRRAGYAGRHVPHGWRASFSTILNEHFPADRAAIDRALAHLPKDKVEAAYNRAEQLDRRRALYDAWAALLVA